MNHGDIMGHSETQAQFFDKLETLGVTRSEIADAFDVGDRQVQRIAAGAPLVPFYGMQALMAASSREIKDAIVHEFLRGTGMTAFHLGAQGNNHFAGAAKLLRDVAELVDRREADMADGKLTDAEKRGELEIVARAIATAQQLYTAIAEQPTSGARLALKA